jgi:hypothetical protein
LPKNIFAIKLYLQIKFWIHFLIVQVLYQLISFDLPSVDNASVPIADASLVRAQRLRLAIELVSVVGEFFMTKGSSRRRMDNFLHFLLQLCAWKSFVKKN